MKPIIIIATFSISILLSACSKETFYTVQFHNKTAFKLDSIKVTLTSSIAEFGLEKDQKSDEFVFKCEGREIIGPILMNLRVIKYTPKDTMFAYKIAQTIDPDDFDDNKTNLIDIEVDTSQFDKNSFFKFTLSK